LRIIDADILSYALFDESPAHLDSWRIIENAIRTQIKLYVAMTSILETYNVLYWFYRVRPRTTLIQKISTVLETMIPVPPSSEGVGLALRENIPLGDGLLLATALNNKIPVVVSNDTHIAKVAPKIGLMVENPLTRKTRRSLSNARPGETERDPN
jgi:predicted nucleic acid-binding protein